MSAQRRSIIWLVLGVMAAAAWGLSAPQLLAHLSPDGAISLPLQERIQSVRLLIGSLAIVLLAGWGLRLRASLVLATAVLAGMLWGGLTQLADLNERRPAHLLFQPKRLLAIALGEELLLSDYAPRTYLVVPQHQVLRAKFPVINIHTHFRNWYRQRTTEEMIRIMDACNLQYLIDLDGRLGDSLREELARYGQVHPDRFIEFATFPFGKRLQPEVFRQQVEQLREAKTLGARGLKLWKNLGFTLRDMQGHLIPIDDLRVEPLWQALGDLHLPVLYHIGDPAANYEAVDRYNEQYEWLRSAPQWAYFDKPVPSIDVLLRQFERVADRHPEVTFILAHLGNRADNLAIPSGIMDRHPNVYMDISAKIQELGRQPRAARAFFVKYQDRLLFGTDGHPDEAVYRAHFRFLETADEYFDYPFWGLFNFGRWKIYGIDLPDEVLRKLYHDNAAKILGLPLLGSGEGSSS